MKIPIQPLAAALFIGLGTLTQAQAQVTNYTWTAAVDTNFSTVGNFFDNTTGSTATVPIPVGNNVGPVGSNIFVTFDGTTSSRLVDLTAATAYNVRGIEFGASAGSSGYTIGSSLATAPRLQIRPDGIVNNAIGTQTFNVPMRLFSYGGGANPPSVTLNAAAGNIVISGVYGGTLATIDANQSAGGGSGIIVDGAFNTTIGTTGRGDIINGHGLTKNGAGILTLGGTVANSFLGPITVNGGTLVLNKVGAISGEGNTKITVNTNAVLSFAADSTMGNLGPAVITSDYITLNNGTMRYTGAGSSTTPVNRGMVLGASGGIIQILNAGGTWNYQGNLRGAGTLTKTGAGLFALQAVNPGNPNFTGKLVVNQGTLSAQVDGQLGAVPGGLVSDAITLDGGAFRSAAGFTMNANRGIVLGAGGGTIDAASGTLIYNGVISGVGAFTKSGAQTLNLGGDNTYSGTTTVTAGTLVLGASERLPNGTALTLSGGTFNLNGFTEVVGSLAGAGAVNLGSGSLIAGALGNTTYSGVMSGAGGSLIKQGVGTTMTLTGSNTFTGGTLVTGGKLMVNNAGGSGTGTGSVTINNGATLGGSGTIAGAVILNSGAIISPGTSSGTLNTGSETWSGGAGYLWEINNATGTAGAASGWDLLNITGGLLISADAGNKFDINITSLTLANVAGNAVNFNGGLAYDWVIAKTTTGVTGFDVSAFNLVASGFSNPHEFAGFSVGLQNGGNDLVVSYIPEPGTYATLLFGLIGLIAGRRFLRK